MNIGTMGAAVIMNGNATRMSRYGGGSGGSNKDEKDEEPKGFWKVAGLLIFNTIMFSIALTILNMDAGRSDYMFKDVQSKVVDKQIHKERASKGQVYDDPYLKLEYPSGKVKWIGVSMTEYLNTSIGSKWTEQVPKKSASLLRWIMVFTGLAWIVGASTSLTKAMMI